MQVMTALSVWRHQAIRGAFSAWSAYMDGGLAQRQLAESALLRLMHGLEAAAFAAWREHASAQADLRARLQHALGAMQHQAIPLCCLCLDLCSGTSLWTPYMASLLSVQLICLLLMSSWMSLQTLARALHGWIEQKEEQKRLRICLASALRRWQQSALSRAFHSLREHAAFQQKAQRVCCRPRT